VSQHNKSSLLGVAANPADATRAEIKAVEFCWLDVMVQMRILSHPVHKKGMYITHHTTRHTIHTTHHALYATHHEAQTIKYHIPHNTHRKSRTSRPQNAAQHLSLTAAYNVVTATSYTHRNAYQQLKRYIGNPVRVLDPSCYSCLGGLAPSQPSNRTSRHTHPAHMPHIHCPTATRPHPHTQMPRSTHTHTHPHAHLLAFTIHCSQRRMYSHSQV